MYSSTSLLYDPTNWSLTHSNIINNGKRNYFFILLLRFLSKEQPGYSMRIVDNDMIRKFKKNLKDHGFSEGNIPKQPFSIEKNIANLSSCCCVNFKLHHDLSVDARKRNKDGQVRANGIVYYITGSHLTSYPRFSSSQVTLSAFHHTLELEDSHFSKYKIHLYFDEYGELMEQTVHLKDDGNLIVSTLNPSVVHDILKRYILNPRYSESFLKIMRKRIEDEFIESTPRRVQLTNILEAKIKKLEALKESNQLRSVKKTEITYLKSQINWLLQTLKFDMKFSGFLTKFKKHEYETYYLKHYPPSTLNEIFHFLKTLLDADNLSSSLKSSKYKEFISHNISVQKNRKFVLSSQKLKDLHNRLKLLCEEASSDYPNTHLIETTSDIKAYALFQEMKKNLIFLMGIEEDLKNLKIEEPPKPANIEITQESSSVPPVSSLESSSSAAESSKINPEEEPEKDKPEVVESYKKMIALCVFRPVESDSKLTFELISNIREISRLINIDTNLTLKTKERLLKKTREKKMKVFLVQFISFKNTLAKKINLSLKKENVEKNYYYLNTDNSAEKIDDIDKLIEMEKNWVHTFKILDVLTNYILQLDIDRELCFTQISKSLEKSFIIFLDNTNNPSQKTLLEYFFQTMKEPAVSDSNDKSLLENLSIQAINSPNPDRVFDFNTLDKILGKDFFSQGHLDSLRYLYQFAYFKTNFENQSPQPESTPLSSLLDNYLKNIIDIYLGEKLNTYLKDTLQFDDQNAGHSFQISIENKELFFDAIKDFVNTREVIASEEKINLQDNSFLENSLEIVDDSIILDLFEQDFNNLSLYENFDFNCLSLSRHLPINNPQDSVLFFNLLCQRNSLLTMLMSENKYEEEYVQKDEFISSSSSSSSSKKEQLSLKLKENWSSLLDLLLTPLKEKAVSIGLEEESINLLCEVFQEAAQYLDNNSYSNFLEKVDTYWKTSKEDYIFPEGEQRDHKQEFRFLIESLQNKEEPSEDLSMNDSFIGTPTRTTSQSSLQFSPFESRISPITRKHTGETSQIRDETQNKSHTDDSKKTSENTGRKLF